MPISLYDKLIPSGYNIKKPNEPQQKLKKCKFCGTLLYYKGDNCRCQHCGTEYWKAEIIV